MVVSGPKAVGYFTAMPNESSMTAHQEKSSVEVKGAALGTGSAGRSSVFTIVRTRTVVKPATSKVAIHPPTALPMPHSPPFFVTASSNGKNPA